MANFGLFFLACVVGTIAANVQEKYFQENRKLAKAIVEALQDSKFEDELLFDLKKENQVYLNRTMSLVIKYIVKREVDNYRSRRTDAISRRIYSSLIMKLIDIAKDLPRNASASSRIDTAHRYYTSVESRDMHDHMADVQVFHACARLYDVMFTDLPRNASASSRIDTAHRYYTSVESRDMHDHMADVQVFHACARLYDVMVTAPRILAQLGKLDDLTPRLLVKKLKSMEIKPVHLGVALLIQYYLRNTVNFAIKTRTIEVLATKPQEVGPAVIDMLKALAAKLLPVAELLDVHLAHSSPAFKDSCPNTWLGIVNNKQL